MNQPIDYLSVSPHFELPFLFAGQAQKELFVNEAMARVDALLHPIAEGFASAPPAAALDGQCWFVSEGAAGDWRGRDGQLAIFTAGRWLFIRPCEAMLVFDRSARQYRQFNEEWVGLSAPALPTGGATVDTQARAAIGDILATLASFGIISRGT